MFRRVLLAPVCSFLFPFVFASTALAQYARVSIASDGTGANFSSASPSISDDGRFVAFSSAATNLVAGDTNDKNDVYLHDRDVDADGIFDEAGARSTVRVSITTFGEQFGHCLEPKISGNGRFVTFLTNETLPQSLIIGGGNGFSQILRWDRLTGAIVIVSQAAPFVLGNGNSGLPDMSNDGRRVVFLSDATNFVDGPHGEIPNIFVRDMETGVIRRLSEPSPSNGDTVRYSAPSISGDGVLAVFSRIGVNPQFPQGGTDSGIVFAANLDAGTAATEIGSGTRVRVSDDGRDVFVLGGRSLAQARPGRLHVETGERTPTDDRVGVPVVGTDPMLIIGQNARHAVWFKESPTPSVLDELFDLQYERSFPLPFRGFGGSFDASGRLFTFATSDTLAPGGGDTNNANDIYVADLSRVFDKDEDTLDDRWETLFGLSTTAGTGDDGADGPNGDPDSDGLTNAQEQSAGTHPRGLHKVYLAEGATGSFFQTRLALANASPVGAVVVSFLRAGLAPVRTTVMSAGRRTLSPTTFTGLEAAEFSTVVESEQPMVVDRTMMWDATGYGAHTETASPAPSTTWYLAEGSTVLDFDLFYLLQNPQSVAVDATIRYLRPVGGAPIVKPITLPPNSRTTVYVNDADAALGETDVSAVVEAPLPIVVERAMYASRGGKFLALGTVAKGITTPATEWFLAEGATGTFFDTYVLIANPTTDAASVRVRFLKPDGSVVTETHTVAAQSRFSIFVDSIAGLENTAVSTTVTSLNAVPLIVERAMYWPNGFFDYYEGHTSAGTTSTATRWLLAEGEVAGPLNGQTFVLIANTSSQAGQARLTTISDMEEQRPMNEQTIDLPPNSRTTVEIAPLSSLRRERFATLVESIGASPVPIVVEGAFYWSSGGLLWSAGSGVVATPIP
jgi:hypothetical protein